MNYLAHFFLSDSHSEERAGALLGDFFKGPVDDSVSRGVARGITLHRKVDVFTDAHPVTRQSRDRFKGKLRRYAGIIVDIAYDHFLATKWSTYSQIPLPIFVLDVYASLRTQRACFEGRSLRVVERMTEQDWLGSYASLQSVTEALGEVSRRFSRPNPLSECGTALEGAYVGLSNDFDRFFPALVTHSAKLRAEV